MPPSSHLARFVYPVGFRSLLTSVWKEKLQCPSRISVWFSLVGRRHCRRDDEAANAVAMGAFDEYKRDAEQRLPAGWTYMVRRHAEPTRIHRTAAA